MGAGLRVEDVHKRYETEAEPVVVLSGASFAAGPGEAIAITGPSGSGKSTLLHLIGGLDRPTSGRIEVDGRDPHGLGERELARFRNLTMGFVFQDHHLLPQYSVLENVLLPAFAFPGPRDEQRARARDLVDRVGLAHRASHLPSRLSGGERQRVAVARALINRPRLLLCDEPTGSLDARTADAIGSLLFDVHHEQGTILLVVTHSLELADRFPRRIELKDGRCVEG
jgi:lipoprotein-releasing system ATP-binding protein